MDCYNCKHSREIVGDCHLECANPQITQYGDILPIFITIGILNGRRLSLIEAMGLSFDSYGISRGWCNFPINFDPIWIRTCGSFEKKEI